MVAFPESIFHSQRMKSLQQIKVICCYSIWKGNEINLITSTNSQQDKSDTITKGHFVTEHKLHVHKRNSNTHNKLCLLRTIWHKFGFDLLFKMMNIFHIKDWKYFHFCLSQKMMLIFWNYLMLLLQRLKITTDQQPFSFQIPYGRTETCAAGSV